MKSLYLLPLIMLWAACAVPTTEPAAQAPSPVAASPLEKHVPAMQAIVDSAKVKGTILIFDPAANTYYSNDFDWARQGYLPASTFKIPNSIIALETGVVEDDSTMFYWDGKPRRMKGWEADMTFRQAIVRSCLPCYRQVARDIGVARMRAHLERFDYGDIEVDSSNLDLFWVVGDDAHISPFQQIEFLRKLYYQKLPIQARTYEIMRRMLVLEEKEAYTLNGKTGWAIIGELNQGWFVGFIEKGESVSFFATHIEPGEGLEMDRFFNIRSEITLQAFEQLGVL